MVTSWSKDKHPVNGKTAHLSRVSVANKFPKMVQCSPLRMIFSSLRQNFSPKQAPSSTGVRRVSTKYAGYFATLNLPTSASKADVRSSYLEQVAKLEAGHLDHGGAEQFAKIDVAFKGLLVKFEEDKERENETEAKYSLTKKDEEGAKEEGGKYPHIAQHWQLLDSGGVGVHSSSPAQKQKQALKDRALKANQAVSERRMSQNEDGQVTADRALVKGHQTKNQMDRLVEDLIQEGMAKGTFDNLKGAGKPLPERPPDFNPFMDFTTHKMNQVITNMKRKLIFETIFH